MATNEKELQEELGKIKNSRFSVKGYFHQLFAQLMPQELLDNKRITVIDELITQETLPIARAKKYDHDGYALLFYAHRTHSTWVSPFNHDKNAAHTSLLLCKITDGKINHILNIDGYHNLPYMDIIGERGNSATSNPHIKNRLVINAPDDGDLSTPKPLQGASWENLNCPLYAFVFAKAILNAFNFTPEVLDDLFVGSNTQPSTLALDNLKAAIIQGAEGIYVKRKNVGNDQIIFCRDTTKGMEFHNEVREELAQTIEAQYRAQPIKDPATDGKTPTISVTPVSLFKQPTSALDQLGTLCTKYQAHLYEEIKNLTNTEPASVIQAHQENKNNTPQLNLLINKYNIVAEMVKALHNEQEPEEIIRIQNMKNILTPENKEILAEHREFGGKFLHGILSRLSAIFRQEWKYRAKGGLLS
jgi:hypothetical protein